MHKHLFACGLAAALLAPFAAKAHVTFEIAQTPANATYKAVLRMPHGCDGKATDAVRVDIPEGVIEVKPMPKPGWKLGTTKGDYARAYDYYGTPTAKGVRTIVWSNGNLPDDWYDEFVFTGHVADLAPGTVLAFPVVQTCVGGEVRWDQVAAPGKDPEAVEHPAPTLAVMAAGGDMGMAGHDMGAMETGGHDTVAQDMGTPAMAGDIAVGGAWARETTPGARAGAVYLTMDNKGDAGDRLVGAATAAANEAMLHTHTMQDGVMKMRPVDAVDVPAHGQAMLKPGGFHVMLTGLKGPLKEGATFP